VAADDERGPDDFMDLAPHGWPIALTTPREHRNLRDLASEAFQWSSRNPRARAERGKFMTRLHRRWLLELGYDSASTDELRQLVANPDTPAKVVKFAARQLERQR
jgi:hypothetical protein